MALPSVVMLKLRVQLRCPVSRGCSRADRVNMAAQKKRVRARAWRGWCWCWRDGAEGVGPARLCVVQTETDIQVKQTDRWWETRAKRARDQSDTGWCARERVGEGVRPRACRTGRRFRKKEYTNESFNPKRRSRFRFRWRTSNTEVMMRSGASNWVGVHKFSCLRNWSMLKSCE